MYPAYARSERIADGAIHLTALVLSVVGTVLLVVFAGLFSDGPRVAAASVYGAVMILSFAASGLYHFTPWERVRPVFRRIDHAAIYLKIAGTYTPLVVLIGSAFAYGVLALVWLLAAFGAIGKLFFWRNPARVSTALYLVMGWLSVALVWSLFATLPLASTALVVIGGLVYSAGVAFFHWESLKFSNAIWHGFVLVASGCFYAAITTGIFVVA
jgi:hemolysin III